MAEHVQAAVGSSRVAHQVVSRKVTRTCIQHLTNRTVHSLDRVMQAMKSEMNGMSEEQKTEFELAENSRMRTMCGLMDRARGTLVSARFASKSIIPPSWQKDKSGLGVTGLKYEPLLPKLQEKAEAAGIYWNENKLDQLWGNQMKKKATSGPTDSSSESSSEESSDEDSDSEDSEVSEEEADDEKDGSNGVESNQFFVVDTKPTPVDLTGATPKSKKEKKSKKAKGTESTSADSIPAKKSRKRSSDDDVEQPTSPKKSKATAEDLANVDFTAVEAQLQAEVEAGMKAKEKELQKKASQIEEESEELAKSKKEKKRKRNSDGTQAVVDSLKKKQRLEVRQKNKDEVAASGDSAGKASKKSKKRKAEEDDTEGKTKKSRAEE